MIRSNSDISWAAFQVMLPLNDAKVNGGRFSLMIPLPLFGMLYS